MTNFFWKYDRSYYITIILLWVVLLEVLLEVSLSLGGLLASERGPPLAQSSLIQQESSQYFFQSVLDMETCNISNFCHRRGQERLSVPLDPQPTKLVRFAHSWATLRSAKRALSEISARPSEVLILPRSSLADFWTMDKKEWRIRIKDLRRCMSKE
jgi:hypothetical protein